MGQRRGTRPRRWAMRSDGSSPPQVRGELGASNTRSFWVSRGVTETPISNVGSSGWREAHSCATLVTRAAGFPSPPISRERLFETSGLPVAEAP
jgi:hypothetical protein